MSEGVAMPHHPEPTDAPYELDSDRSRWLYTDGEQVPIVARSRRRIVVDAFGDRYHLKRRDLEHAGVTTVDGRTFTVSSYLSDQDDEDDQEHHIMTKTTDQKQTETLEHLSKAEQEAQAAAAKAQAAAQEAAAKAQAARDRVEQASRDAVRRYALNVRGANKERRPELLKAITEARERFRTAVVAGEAFGPAYLDLVKAEAALYTQEVEYAEALTSLGQAPMRWPEARRIDLAAALTEALEGEGCRIQQDAVEAMKVARQRWIAQQVANDTPADAGTGKESAA